MVAISRRRSNVALYIVTNRYSNATMATIPRMTVSASSTRRSRLKMLSKTALGKAACVSAETLSPRCRLGRSDMRFGRTRTAVSGLTCILRETSFISQ